MKRIICLLVVTLFALSQAFGVGHTYHSVKGDPINARIYTLNNGLKVYMSVNKEAPRIQTYIAVKVGGKNDPSETTGLAHYFEHLMFKGSQKFGTQDYAKEKVLLDQIEAQFEIYRKTTDTEARQAIYKVIDSLSYEASKISIPNEYDKLMAAIGADGTNAYTSFDQTVYIENIPSNQIENWAKIQADRFENNVIRGFHTELETVYEEKNMSLTNDGRKVLETLLSALFPDHPYGQQTVLGTQEHLKNPSITNIKNYHRTWYVPNNMAVIVAGDFDPDHMIATIEKYFGGMKANPNLPKLDVKKGAKLPGKVEKEVIGLDAENVSLGWRFDGAASKDAEILSLISDILHNGKAGLIDLDLMQKQKVLSASAYFMEMEDYSIMSFSGRPKLGQTLEEVRDLLLAEVNKLKTGDFDEILLKATINNYKAQIMGMIESDNGRAQMMLQSFVNGIKWEDMVTLLDRMSKITKEEIVAFAKENFGDNYAVIYKREGKDKNEKKMDKPQITPIFTNRDVASNFLKEVQNTQVKPIEPVFLDYNKDLSKAVAKSNIPLLYKQNATNDLFSIDYVFETGLENDPLANMAFGYMEYLGTSKMTPEQIKQEFYNLACSFKVSSGSRRSYVTLSGLGENMTKAMELLENLLADAQPNAVALENMKQDMLKRRSNAKLNQGSNFGALQAYSIYGPEYIKAMTLSDQQINDIKPEDLLGRIHNINKLEHRILYYGPLAQKDVLTKINAIHSVPAKLQPVKVAKRYLPLQTPENKVFLAEYDAKQIYYAQLSNRGEKYDPIATPAIMIYNSYFGGGMNSVVFQEMREARGLAYSAAATIISPTYLDTPYMMFAFIATQNDKMGQAVDAFEDIINNMPQSENAFNIAKNAAISNYRTSRITKSAVLRNYIASQDLDLNYDSRKNNYEAIQKMTLEDVIKTQQKWVKDRKYTFMVLGDSKDLDMEKLKSLGEVKILSKEDIFGF